MARIQIRNIEDSVALKLTELAGGGSREDYLRRLLTLHAQSSEITEQRFMYEELVERLTKALEDSNTLFENVAKELRDVKLELEAIRNG